MISISSLVPRACRLSCSDCARITLSALHEEVLPMESGLCPGNASQAALKRLPFASLKSLFQLWIRREAFSNLAAT